jgi:hypothetical protein
MSDTETEFEFPATLDLTSADTRGNFMEGGWKDAIVGNIEMIKAENPDGNLPLNTPGINVQFTIDGGQYDNRKVWNRYWFPPAEYDAQKRDRSLGMFVRFLVAIGYDEKEVKANGFNLDANIGEMVGKECQVNTKYDENYDNNKVTGVRARQALSDGGTAGGVL